MVLFLDKSLFFLLAAPAVLRAWWRSRRLASGRLDDVAVGLRRVPEFRCRYLANPVRLAACADRWLRWLSRRNGSQDLGSTGQGSKGHCLDHALMLLDLWSRCGLRPALRLGAVRAEGRRHFHAWITAPGGPSSGAGHHHEIWDG